MRKKFISFGMSIAFLALLTFACVLTQSAFAAADSNPFSGGDGSAENPYIVRTADDFLRVRGYLDKYFVQDADIDFASVNGFTGIGSQAFPFSGHYDGKRYLISNLVVTAQSDYAGLFNVVTGSVKNITLKSGKISGTNYVGGIAGINNGTIEGCVNQAEIDTGGEYAGGIAGNNTKIGNIISCANKGNVSGGAIVGGITGANSANLKNCYNVGDLSVRGTFIGGIVGVNKGDTSVGLVQGCYSMGKIEGHGAGGIAGDNWKGNIHNTFWTNAKLPAIFDSGEITYSSSVPYSQLCRRETFEGWSNFDKNWIFLSENAPPILRAEYVKVERIKIAGEEEIEAGDTHRYSIEIFPKNATLQSGSFIADRCDDYEIDEQGTLKVSDCIAVGTKIEVCAAVGSVIEKLSVVVVKTPVTEIELTTIENADTLKHGETLHFKSRVLPDDATEKGVIYKVSNSFALITQGGELSLTSNAPVGLRFEVTAISRDNPAVSASFSVSVAETEVEQILITSQSSFKVTERFELSASVIPRNATNNKVSFKILSSTASGAKIVYSKYLVADGLGTITFVACAGGKESEPFTVEVRKEPVTKLEFNISAVCKITGRLKLEAKVFPKNATFSQVRYEILSSTAQNAHIENGYLFADYLGEVTVAAYADEIRETRTVTFLKEPVTRVKISANSISEDPSVFQFNAVAYPLNATFREITYTLLKGQAKLSAQGLLEIDEDAYAGSEILVKATADGIDSEVYKLIVGGVAVDSVSLFSPACELMQGRSVRLTTTTVPEIVSNPNISYRVSGHGEMRAGTLYIAEDAEVGSYVTVTAIVDGKESNSVTIKVLKVPAEKIEFTCASSFKTSEALALCAKVYPLDTTYNTVTYSIVENGIGAVLNGNILTCRSVGRIKVKAEADGISAEIYIDVEKEPVIEIEITVSDGEAETVLEGGLYEYKITQNRTFSFKALPECATDTNVEFTLFCEHGMNARFINGKLLVDTVGTVHIRFQAADGVERILNVTVLKEPVTEIRMTCSNRFKITQQLFLTAQALPANATFQSVSFQVASAIRADGTSFIAYIDENGFLNAKDVGTITVIASADGVTQSFTVFADKEPVNGIAWTLPQTFKTSEAQKLNANAEGADGEPTYGTVTYYVEKEGKRERLFGDNNNEFRFEQVGAYRLWAVADGFEQAFDVTVTEEPVTDIEVKFDLGTGSYEVYTGLTLEQGSVFIFNAKALAYAGAAPTYSALRFKFAYAKDGERFDLGVKNNFFTYDTKAGIYGQISIRINAPVTKTVWLIAEVVTDEGTVKFSKAIPITVKLVSNLYETSNYDENTISLYKGNNDIIKSYEIMLTADGKTLTKSYKGLSQNYEGEAKDKISYFLFKNGGIGSNYSLSVTVTIIQRLFDNTTQEFTYSDIYYESGTDKNGKNLTVYSQKNVAAQISSYRNTSFNTIVSFDFYSVSYNDITFNELSVNDKTSVVYIKGNPAKKLYGNIRLNTPSDSSCDLHLNGTNIVSSCEVIYASGLLNLYTYNTFELIVTNGVKGDDGYSYSGYGNNVNGIKGEDGKKGSAGYNAIYANNLSLKICSGFTYIYGGRGGDGGNGGRGQDTGGGNIGTMTTAGSGGLGGTGGRGGDGIHCYGNLVIENCDGLYVYAGYGGNGGRGGDGGNGRNEGRKDNGGNGGRGGQGGDGGIAVYCGTLSYSGKTAFLYGALSGHGGCGGNGGGTYQDSSVTPKTGNGGQGGNGGWSDYVLKQLNASGSPAGIRYVTGSGGSGGSGGTKGGCFGGMWNIAYGFDGSNGTAGSTYKNYNN